MYGGARKERKMFMVHRGAPKEGPPGLASQGCYATLREAESVLNWSNRSAQSCRSLTRCVQYLARL